MEMDLEELENKLVKLIPEDLEKYPDFPEFLDDMSYEDYFRKLKKYWRDRKRSNPEQKEKNARKRQQFRDKQKKRREGKEKEKLYGFIPDKTKNFKKAEKSD